MVSFFPPRPAQGLRALLTVLLLAAVLSGCAAKKHSGDDEKYVQDTEELVEVPYIPRDDGLPLAPNELKAFNTKGQLDANLSQEDTRTVELHFKFFVHQHRRTFERYLERSGRYLPYVKKVFTERGLPEELAYLFMVESGGNPNAISPVGATGLWQFMPFTGKKFGLKQTSWHDERRDPFKATYAASDYLLKLYDDFSNWHLAAAAYNAGEGKIGRAVDGTGAVDFFELCRLDCVLEEKAQLKDETRQYVPRLIAIAKIMRNLELLGFTKPSPADAYDLQTISVPPGTNLTGLARNLGLTWDEFSAMNPAFRRTASPPTATTTAYVLPTMVAGAETWLASDDARMYAGWKEYTVQKRDTLASIAKRNRISVASLRQANGFSALPKPGSTIMLPGGSRKADPVMAALPESTSPVRGRVGKHTVGAGDTLFSLARAWGTTPDSIRQLNKLSSDMLQQGQRLSVPSDSKDYKASAVVARQGKASARQSAAASHTVRKGETLSSIAAAYNVSVGEVMRANNFTSKSRLSLGQSLDIPQKAEPAARQETASAATDKAAPPAKQTTAGKPGATSKQPQGTKAAAQKAEPVKLISRVQAADAGTPAKANVKVATIQQGDTLYSLAKKHNTSVGDLRKANKLTEKSHLKLGQQIVIP